MRGRCFPNPMLVLGLLATALAATLPVSIANLQAVDVVSTSLVLRDLETHQRQRLPVQADGTAVFRQVNETHSHLLSMDSDTLELPFAYVVKAPNEFNGSNWDVRKVRSGQPLSVAGALVGTPLKISEHKRMELVVDRPEFSIFKFLTQKSVMLMIAALAMVTYLPTLLSMLDPDTLEELQRNQLASAKKTAA